MLVSIKIFNSIQYLVKRHFINSVNTAKTKSFPEADIGTDHDLTMMTFRLRLKKTEMLGPTRIKLDLQKLKDPQVAEAFLAMIGGRIAPLNLARCR